MSEKINNFIELGNYKYDLTLIVSIISLCVSCILGVIAVKTFKSGQRQRKFENSLKLLESFRISVNEDDITSWKEMFVNSSELTGATYGYFKFKGELVAFSELFSEGGSCYDRGAIDRIASQLNLIGYQYKADTIDIVIIYFEIGQIIDTVHNWLKSIKTNEDRYFITENFPFLVTMFKKIEREGKAWPKKTLIYIE